MASKLKTIWDINYHKMLSANFLSKHGAMSNPKNSISVFPGYLLNKLWTIFIKILLIDLFHIKREKMSLTNFKAEILNARGIAFHKKAFFTY